MQKIHLYSSVFLIVATVYGVFPELVRTKCSLARALYSNGVPMEELSDWLCIAKHASNYTGNDLFELPDFDGSVYYGVFRISNEFWCESPFRESTNYCKVKCSDIIGPNFTHATKCARMIQKQAGFGAWDQWKEDCQDEESKPKFDECFRTRNMCVDVYTGSTVP